MIYHIDVTLDTCTDVTSCYVARVRELDGCMSHGETANDALENIGETLALYVRALVKRGLCVPAGQPSVRWETTVVANGRGK